MDSQHVPETQQGRQLHGAWRCLAEQSDHLPLGEAGLDRQRQTAVALPVLSAN